MTINRDAIPNNYSLVIYLEFVVLDGLPYEERVGGGGPLSQQHLCPIISELTGLYSTGRGEGSLRNDQL